MTLLALYNKLYKFYGPQAWWPSETPFETIVGAILTQNTSWKNVEKAIANLKKIGGLSSPLKLDKVSEKRLGRIIRPAGYYNIKAKRLKNFLRFLSSSHGGRLSGISGLDTRKLRHELLNINGIGPETADSILLYAFSRPVFVVDAYTKRIFSRHKFFKEDTSYEEVQRVFTANLPRNSRIYNEYHALIVRLAKDFCKKKAPNCAVCPICPTP